jgi:hypothetical protein
MKKVIRLTESDLVRIVKRVINEQQVNDLQSFSNWATKMGTDKQFCPSGPSSGEWPNVVRCPKGSWKFSMKDKTLYFYDIKNNNVAKFSNISYNVNSKPSSLNTIESFFSYSNMKSSDLNGTWQWSGDSFIIYIDNRMVGDLSVD